MAKNRYRCVVTGMLVLVSTIVAAQLQKNVTIKGKVVDQNGNSLPGGSINLRSIKDSSILKSYNWINGTFVLDTLHETHLLLEIKALNYKSYFRNIDMESSESVMDIGTIKLEPDFAELKAVIVNSRFPVVTTKEGNIKIDITNSTAATSSSTIEDLFLKLPGLTIGDQHVIVLGKGEAIVYYNGQKISIEQLKAIPIDRIKQIEVITNPSAKYDAQGNAVVSITGKTNFSEGISGQVRQIVQKGRFFNETTAVSFNYEKNKLSLFGSYNQNTLNINVNNVSNYDVKTSGPQYTGSSNYNYRVKCNFIPTYLLGINYQFDPKNSISLEYKGNNTIEHQIITNDNITRSPSPNLNTVSATENLLHSQWYNNSFSFNYDRKLDTTGSVLSFKAQSFVEVYRYHSRILQVVKQTDSSHFEVNSPARLQLYSVQSDYNKAYKSGSRLSIGLKFSGTNDLSRNDFFLVDDSGNKTMLAQYSSLYRYREYIPALYAEYSGGHKSIEYTIGSRVEFTKTKGFSLLNGQAFLDTSYVNLFPSVNIRKKGKTWTFGLNYSARISRPSYFDVAPYTQYNGPSTIIQTNPRLTPSLTNFVEAYAQVKGYLIKAGFAHTRNDINNFYLYDTSGQVLIQKVNIRSKKNFYVEFNFPISTKYFESSNQVLLNVEKFSDPRFTNSRFGVTPLIYFNSYNTIRIPKVFDIDLVADFNSAHNDGLGRSKSLLYSEIGITKRNTKRNMSVRLSLQDIFNVYHTVRELSYNMTYIQADRRPTVRLVKLTFVYRFGKLKSSNYKNSGAAKENIDRT